MMGLGHSNMHRGLSVIIPHPEDIQPCIVYDKLAHVQVTFEHCRHQGDIPVGIHLSQQLWAGLYQCSHLLKVTIGDGYSQTLPSRSLCQGLLIGKREEKRESGSVIGLVKVMTTIEED